jgi:hypothetical protein
MINDPGNPNGVERAQKRDREKVAMVAPMVAEKASPFAWDFWRCPACVLQMFPAAARTFVSLLICYRPLAIKTHN